MHADAIASELVAHSPVPSIEVIAGGFLARYPAKTRSTYRIHLRQWFTWCAEHGLTPLAAQRAHIEAWARYLTEDRGLKSSSTAAKLNAVCGFYKYANIDGYMPTNPGAYVRRPKVPFQSSTKGLTRPEFADILKASEQDGPMSHLLVCLLGLNGMRIGECLASDIDHVGFERGYRTIHLPHRKGGKVGTLALCQRTAYALDVATAGRTSGPLLLGRDGERMSPGAARRTIARLCRRCGITKRIHPHSLRHTFVTMALDAGVPERDIIDSSGHCDTRMLRYYDRNRGAIERNATHAVAAFVGAAA